MNMEIQIQTEVSKRTLKGGSKRRRGYSTRGKRSHVSPSQSEPGGFFLFAFKSCSWWGKKMEKYKLSITKTENQASLEIFEILLGFIYSIGLCDFIKAKIYLYFSKKKYRNSLYILYTSTVWFPLLSLSKCLLRNKTLTFK